MSRSYDIPHPGETFDGRTVIASSWADDDETNPWYVLLLLNPTAPYFSAVEVNAGDGNIQHEATAYNIGHAVKVYGDFGGDNEGER